MPGVVCNSSSSDTPLPDLHVNDGKLESQSVGLLEPSDPQNTSVEEMRRRLADNGYLFLKGLLPRQDVLEARKNYFEYFERTALLKPASLPVQGIFDPSQSAADYPGIGTGREGTGAEKSKEFIDLALKAHGEPWYKDALCKHPVMEDFIAKLTGWGADTLGLQRTLLRNNLPGNAAIGVHYDYIFLRHGEDSVLTCWVPIGDIKLTGGGLIYLEKGERISLVAHNRITYETHIADFTCTGHELGRETELNFTESAIKAGLTPEEARSAFNQNMMSGGVLTQGAKEFSEQHQRRWLVSAYEAGDVVIHTSYMVSVRWLERKGK